MANRGCGRCEERIYRYDEAGIQEVSTDQGATWTEALSDARMSGTLFPPPPWYILGTDNRCGGAISASEGIKFVTEQITSGSAWDSIFTVIAAIIAFVATFVPAVGPAIAGLITAIAYVLFSLGQEALASAMTEGVYATLKCIFYCHINQDATFSEQGWQEVKNDIYAQLDGLAEVWSWHFVNILGPTGLGNAARLAASITGDCSECECEQDCEPESVWMFDIATGQWSHPTRDANVYHLVGSRAQNGRWMIQLAFQTGGAPNGSMPLGCCDIDDWEHTGGPSIYIVDQWNCDGEQSSGALPPAGCWKLIHIYGNINDDPFTYDVVLGTSEC